MNRHTPLTAALLAAFSTATFAQSTSAEATLPAVTVQAEQPTYNATTATSATKINAPLRDIPQTVNVITQELMRDKGVRSMEDAVKSVPGVSLVHGDGQRDQVFIRGFNSLGDQFIDGIRDDAMYFRDMSNIEQIEVVKGPASVLYGRGSSGGMINRITKKPGIDKSEASLEVGSWNQRRGEFDIARNVKDSNVSFRMTGAIERADSFRDQQFLEREAFAPSVMFNISSDTSLLLQAEYLHDKRVTDFGIPSFNGRPIKVDPSTYYGSANARDADTAEATVAAGSMTLDHRFNGEWSIRNAFRYYQYELDRFNVVPGAVTANAAFPSGYQVARTRGGIARDEHGFFNQTELTQNTTLGGMTHQILYGVEFGVQDRTQLNRSGSAAPVDAFHPNAASGSTTNLTVNPGSSNSGSSTVAGAYVQDLISLSDKWKALFGIRYDSFKQEVNVAAIPDRTDTAWSPRAGVVYQPTTTQSYYASVSKSFQPSAENFNLTAGNAIFDPQETTSKEIGTKLDLFDGKASATASLFNLERTNITTTDPFGITTAVGTQRTNGLELTFAGDLSDGWRISTGYAYLDAKVSKSNTVTAGIAVEGKKATVTPEHSANVWLTKALTPAWTAGAGINYVGDRFADPTNTVTLPSYTTMDAMVSYKIKGVDLQLNIYNLFDKEYIASAHSGLANSLLPGTPRSAMLTARYAF
ncbi:MAG TPA: TonB-dependent siderophore receptor [Oxalicibacterium sp.]|uniref:TonB-dependent receptor n=1 Tax=Oxalicibacterium sp. TaxID=2766525 RepID=UPI002CFA5E98|nr:TonB-dependent siderophore receptor [Oxalicibacterium sp.]HWU99348.1 TonB-dependent siderophore receptor [Oxalicibacterium sp.]